MIPKFYNIKITSSYEKITSDKDYYNFYFVNKLTFTSCSSYRTKAILGVCPLQSTPRPTVAEKTIIPFSTVT